jgi:hypothetical protein
MNYELRSIDYLDNKKYIKAIKNGLESIFIESRPFKYIT